MNKSFVIVAALLSVGAFAQETKVSAEVGVQGVDITGNQDMYNTQIRLDDGLMLRGLSVLYVGSEEEPGFLDRLQINANGFGGNPHGNFSLKATGTKAWRFRLDYRRFEMFSALPGLANPFLEDGVAPGQHTYDRTRQMLDAELVLLTRGKWRPVITYRRLQYDGPGTTTYRLGVDEFLLSSDLDETDTEWRVGLAYHGSAVQGEIFQGQRRFEGSEQTRLLDGTGNQTGPYLGEDIVLDNFNGTFETESDTPTTTATLRATLSKRVNLLANYIHADADSESDDSNSFGGRLADYTVRRFFNGGVQSVRSRTDAPSWRGDLRLEAELPADFELSLGYETRHRELDGYAMLTTLYLDSITFGGGNPGDFSTLVNADTHMEKDATQLQARLAARGLDKFTFWVEALQTEEETTLDQSLAQMASDGGQGGLFERTIDRMGIGAAYRDGATRLSLEHFADDADDAVVRTDFLKSTTTRLRLRTRPVKQLTVSGHAKWRDTENDTTGIALETDSFDMGLNLNLDLTEHASIYAGFGVFDFESSVLWRDPWYDDEISTHLEEGDSLDLGLHWTVKSLELDAGYTTYENKGAVGFELNSWHARASVGITANLRLAAEAAFREYLETNLALADYEADRYAFWLSWKP